MKSTILSLTLYLILLISSSAYSQDTKKNLPEGWQYKELKFPEGTVFVPTPKVPKDDEWLKIIIDNFKDNKKLVTMMIDGKGYSVYLSPQVRDINDSNLGDATIKFNKMVWVDNVIKEFLPEERLNGRKYYVGFHISNEGKKTYDYTSFILLGTMLYSVDVSTTSNDPKTQEICRLIATYLYSPGEIITYYFNPKLDEDNTGKTYREDFNGKSNIFYDYSKTYWKMKNDEFSFSSYDSASGYSCQLPGIFSDFTLTVKAKWNGKSIKNGYGLFFRGNNFNCYAFLVSQNGCFGLSKYIADKWVSVVEWQRKGIASSDYNELKVTCIGPNIKCFINNKKMIDITDNSFSKGEVGLYSDGSVECSFDDFYIGPPEITKEEDSVVEDFKNNYNIFPLDENWNIDKPGLVFSNGEPTKQYYNIIPAKSNECTISTKVKWEGGDNESGYGIVFGYNEKWRYNFLITQNGYYKLSKVAKKWNDIAPWTKTDLVEEGSNELRVTYVNKMIRCYINDDLVISCSDESFNGGKAGLTSGGKVNCSFENFSIKPPDEDDKDETADFIKDAVRENFEVNECIFDTGEYWSIKNGKYYFSNGDKGKIHTIRCDDDYQNYTLSVKAKWEGKAVDDEFGIFFGKAEGAYYTFGIRKDGTFALSKWTGYLWKNLVNPEKSDLVQDGVNELKITCIGNRIIAHLNSIMVINIEDNLIERGYVGIFCSGNANASFDDFRIGDPEKF